jgi:ANTAR domain
LLGGPAVADEFQAALDEVNDAQGRESELWRPFLDVLPVQGASISTMATFLGTETIAASNPQAAKIDELQFDLGEGPCWDALALARPIFEPDIRSDPRRVWPVFSPAIRGENVGALFAFPLLFGPLRLGAVDLYAEDAAQLTALEARRTEALARVASRVVLLRALRLAGDRDPALDVNRFSRRIIHQATGMVIAQLDISAEDAVLLIQAHAFAVDRSMRDVADDIVERRLSFEDGTTGIEHNGIEGSDG